MRVKARRTPYFSAARLAVFFCDVALFMVMRDCVTAVLSPRVVQLHVAFAFRLSWHVARAWARWRVPLPPSSVRANHAATPLGLSFSEDWAQRAATAASTAWMAHAGERRERGIGRGNKRSSARDATVSEKEEGDKKCQ